MAAQAFSEGTGHSLHPSANSFRKCLLIHAVMEEYGLVIGL
jgi:hypothetical protein